MKYLAQTLKIGGLEIKGPIDKFNSIAEIINEVLKFLYPIALFIFFIYLLWAGLDLARNLGNPEIIKKAQARIVNAVVGIVLLAISYPLVKILIDIFF